MYEKILVALDGSPAAEATIPYVQEIAASVGSEVVLLRVCESSEQCDDGGTRQYLDSLATGMVQGIASLQKPSAKSPAVTPVAVSGKPADQIVDYADANSVSLIAIAAHGRSGESRWPIGAVAEKVLHGTRIPILLVTATRQDKAVTSTPGLKKVLVPLDGSEVGEAALSYVEFLALRLGLEVTLLHVLENKYIAYGPDIGGYIPYTQEWLDASRDQARKYLSGVEARLKSKGVPVSSALESGPAAERIIEVAHRAGTDLIAMSTHGRSGVSKWVFGSVAERVLHAGKVPLILVRARPESGK